MQDRYRFSLGALAGSIQPLGPDAVVSVASGEEVELLAVGRTSRLAILRLARPDPAWLVVAAIRNDLRDRSKRMVSMLLMLTTGVVLDRYSYLPVFTMAAVLPLMMIGVVILLIGRVRKLMQV